MSLVHTHVSHIHIYIQIYRECERNTGSSLLLYIHTLASIEMGDERVSMLFRHSHYAHADMYAQCMQYILIWG